MHHSPPPLHPELDLLDVLVGTWSGSGHGAYPTIESFEYAEEIIFSHVGKPFLSYTQRTRRAGDHPDAGQPLHAESGYVRPSPPNGLEMVIAQPSGIVEVDTGMVNLTADGLELRLSSTSVATTPSAKDVTSIERRIDVVADMLTYEVWMGAVGQPHQFHLAATLKRST